MFEVGRIHEIVTAMLSGNQGWKEFRDDFTKDEVGWWLRWERSDELKDNPFLRPRGFDPRQEARAFLHHVLQKYVPDVARSLQSGWNMPTAKINAVNELARLLGVPVPGAMLQGPGHDPDWWRQYQAPPIAPLAAPLFSFGATPGGWTTNGTMQAQEASPRLPPPERSSPPPPPPRSESRAAQLAKLLALISHPNTGEAERIAALTAYQRIMGEVG